jgi:hypothetical protein
MNPNTDLPIHPTLVHPHTGEPLRAVGIVAGRTIWPTLGASPDDAGGEGGGGTGGEGGSGGEGGKGGDDGKGSGEGGKGSEAWKPPASQEEFDRIISDRLGRDRAKFADYDALKDKAGKWDDHETANASEMDKATKKAREEGEAAATEKSNGQLVTFAARAALAEAKALNAATAVKALDVSQVKVDKDGTVDEAAMKTAIEALKKSDPYLFDDGKGSGGSHRDAGIGGGGSGDGKTRSGSLGAAVGAHYGANK